jgi:hypothetical protein
VLREGARVVVAGAGDLPTRADCVKEGWSCLAAMVDEAQGGAIVAWARAASAVREHPRDYVLVKSAGDLVNAARAGRTALLPCLRCPASAKAFPGVLALLRDSGVRWVAPFDAAVPLTPAERDAILAAAAEGKVVVDLTDLPPEGLEAAVARGASLVATYRRTAPFEGDAAAQAAALQALRTRLGANVLLCLSGGAEAPLFTAAALEADDVPALARVAVVEPGTAGLTALLATPPEDGPPTWSEPRSKGRARLREYFGNAFAALLRRLP